MNNKGQVGGTVEQPLEREQARTENELQKLLCKVSF